MNFFLIMMKSKENFQSESNPSCNVGTLPTSGVPLQSNPSQAIDKNSNHWLVNLSISCPTCLVLYSFMFTKAFGFGCHLSPCLAYAFEQKQSNFILSLTRLLVHGCCNNTSDLSMKITSMIALSFTSRYQKPQYKILGFGFFLF